jgi:hypothetical protein
MDTGNSGTVGLDHAVTRDASAAQAVVSTEGDPHEVLGRLADRALTFQNFILRRAFGLYYAIWAAAFVVFILFPVAVSIAYPTLSGWGLAVYYAFIAGILLGAIWATSWAFGQTYRTSRFRDARAHRTTTRSYFGPTLVIGVAIFVLVVAVALLNSFAGLLVLDACLGGVNLWLLFTVRRVFERLPPEGAVAVGTYAISIVGSAVALVLTRSPTDYALLWLVAIAGWTFCGIYALYHASEELASGAGA